MRLALTAAAEWSDGRRRAALAAVAASLAGLTAGCGPAPAGASPAGTTAAAPPVTGPLTLRLDDGSALPVTLVGCGWYPDGPETEFGWATPGGLPTSRGGAAAGTAYLIFAPRLPSTSSSLAGAITVRRGDPTAPAAVAGPTWTAISGTGYLSRQGGAVQSAGAFDGVVLTSPDSGAGRLTLGGRWTCDIGQPK